MPGIRTRARPVTSLAAPGTSPAVPSTILDTCTHAKCTQPYASIVVYTYAYRVSQAYSIFQAYVGIQI